MLWDLHKSLCTVETYFILVLFTACNGRRQRDYQIPPSVYNEEGCLCVWTEWMNNSDFDPFVGDDTTYDNLRKSYKFCENPVEIICREKLRWYVPFAYLNIRNTVCDVKTGLRCVSNPTTSRRRVESPYYCDDFEVMVLCCGCSTTTDEIPFASTSSFTEERSSASTSVTTMNRVQVESTNSSKPVVIIPQQDQIRKHDTSSEQFPLVMVIALASLGGCFFVALGIIVCCFIKRRLSATRKDKSRHSFYQEVEAPMREPPAITSVQAEALIPQVTRAAPSGSSDYRTTSSEDEGYRSRPSYSNRRLKTKRQRNRHRKHRQNSPNCLNTSDSLELPIQDSQSPLEDHSDAGRFRKWFPDEYERAQEQKEKKSHDNRKKSTFLLSFKNVHRKSELGEIV